MVELAAREAQQVFGAAAYQRGGPGATFEQISRDLRMLVSRALRFPASSSPTRTT